MALIPPATISPDGLVRKHILPRLINLTLQNKNMVCLRAVWIPMLVGKSWKPVYGVEPSRELQRVARERAADTRLSVEFLTQSAQAPLPLPEAGVNIVVAT
jgi:hypothetical protein